MGKPIKFVTPELRLSYCHLLEPRKMSENSQAKYGVTVLIPKSDTKLIKLIESKMEEAIAENQDKLKGKKAKALKMPLRDGDDKADENPEYEGHLFMNIASKDKPLIIDTDRNEVINSREIYSGMRGKVSFNFYAFDTDGNKGIACGLNAVQKTNDDEPFGASYRLEDAVSDFDGESKPSKSKKKAEEEDDDDLL